MIPRQIVPGRTYLVTRRVARREFRLRPSPAVNQLLLYCLAIAAKVCGIHIHAFAFLSNHHHTLLTDPRGNLPLFCQHFHGLVARALNCYHGRWEFLWGPGSYSAVLIESVEDLLEKLEYIYANPVTAKLVMRSMLWPGLITTPRDLAGRTRVATRPGYFFSKRTDWPKKVKLHLSAPPLLQGREEEAITALEERLAFRESMIGERMKHRGEKFLGVKAVLAQSPFEFPRSWEPRRRLDPQVAGKDPQKRLEALRRLLDFRWKYALSREQFRSGNREVLFPAGTYGPRVVYGARVEAWAPG